MPKKGGSSNQDANITIQEIMPKIKAATTLIFLLMSANYQLWAVRIEVHIERLAHSFGDTQLHL